MKNVRKQRIIKLVTIEGSRNYLVLELNYHITNLLAIEMRKNQI